jgi:hypothetical protein
MRPVCEEDANEVKLDEETWVQNDVNVMEADCEERRKTAIPQAKYRFAGEIGKTAQVEMWRFAGRWEREYCSAVLSPEDKGARDIVDLSAVRLDRI